MQSTKAKQDQARDNLVHAFGPPGVLEGSFGDSDVDEPTQEEPELERRRWPMSRGARAIVEAAAAAFTLETEKFQQAQLDRERRIGEAMKLDELPKLGAGFHGAMQDGDDWVEVLPQDVARMQAQAAARSG